MKLFGRKLEGFLRALVVLAAVLLVASGLCGLSSSIEARHGWTIFGQAHVPNTVFGNTLNTIDLVSLLGIVISVIGIAFVLVAWPISFIYRLVTKPEKDRVESLFHRKAETKHDDEQ
ncbi:MAG: hypothetical protein WAN35_13285 [Terracidiphilus sp.]